MAPEPRHDTTDLSQMHWNNWTELSPVANATEDGANSTEASHHPNYSHYIVISILTVLISLCGMVGNGTVIWLLGFRLKRNPYSVYILNLAVADFMFLLTVVLNQLLERFYDIFNPYTFHLFSRLNEGCHNLSYCADQGLLMAVSTERCVSVLWPLWYKCHRPAYLSCTVCSLLWSLSFTIIIANFLCKHFGVDYIMIHFYDVLLIITFLVLSVSGLTLVIRVRCCSRQRQVSKLYVTILLNVLAFLLLYVPVIVFMACRFFISIIDTIPRTLYILYITNYLINPVIYFFVGRHRQQRGRKTLGQVLQTALMDEEEGAGQGREITVPRQDRACPEHQRGSDEAESDRA